VKNARETWWIASLVTAILGLAAVSTLVGGGAEPVLAQAYGAPASIKVAGQPVCPTISEAQPTIQGTAPGGSKLAIRLTPGGISISAVTGSKGTFEARVPSALALGTYSLFIDDKLAGCFVISGSSAGGGSGSTIQLLLFGIVGLLVIAGLAAGARELLRRRQKGKV
jgi:hypothetical protein